MNRPLLISISLAANLLLGAAYVKSHRSISVVPTPSKSVEMPPPLPHIATQSTKELLALEAARKAAEVRWDDIESDDFKELIQRLRAHGCPEQTVRDIIIARVDRRFGKTILGLQEKVIAEQNDAYWKKPKGSREQRSIWRKVRELEREKTALLVELFGTDPRDNGLPGSTNWEDLQLAYLPKEKRDAVRKVVEDHQERLQDFYESNHGFWDAETSKEQRRLEAEQLKSLAEIMTPGELKQWELRNSQTANQLHADLRDFKPTEAEYIALFEVQQKFKDSTIIWGGDELSKEEMARINAAQEAKRKAVAEALGPERAKELALQQDYQYQSLDNLSSRLDLPEGTAKQVYDYKEAAEDAVRKLQQDANLPAERRQQALQEIRRQTENSVKEALGVQGWKRYINNGGWWINNLAPAPVVAPTPILSAPAIPATSP